MSDFAEINLEEGMPSADEAMRKLRENLQFYKNLSYKCVVVIHGYGSSGKGGLIGKKARTWLAAQEKKKFFHKVIFGENFDIFHEDAVNIKNKFKGLSKYFGQCNFGITVVRL